DGVSGQRLVVGVILGDHVITLCGGRLHVHGVVKPSTGGPNIGNRGDTTVVVPPNAVRVEPGATVVYCGAPGQIHLPAARSGGGQASWRYRRNALRHSRRPTEHHQNG